MVTLSSPFANMPQVKPPHVPSASVPTTVPGTSKGTDGRLKFEHQGETHSGDDAELEAGLIRDGGNG